MSFESLAFDSLELNDGTTYRLQESLEIAPPPKRLLWLAGREGDILGDVPGYERRTVTARVRIMPAAAMDTALTSLGAITDKLQKAERTNGGISLVWTPAGSTYSKTIKVLAGEITDLPLSPDASYFRRAPYITLRLDCKPFLYGSETSYATVTSSNPHVVAMARSVAGDVSAEGRLILTDMASQERDFAEWGLDPDPITLDALALSYTPSLLLKLGSSGGLTDQSGNGYNGTAQGGVTVGGASSLLTGDDATSTDFDGSNDYISTTYGAQYATAALIQQLDSETFVYTICRLSNGVVLAGTEGNGKIFRSTDSGATWTLVGTNIAGAAKIHEIIDCGSGVCLAATDNAAKVSRSTDYGLTWTNAGASPSLATEETVNTLIHLGGGRVLAGTRKAGAGGKVFISTDSGATWNGGTSSFSTGNQGVNTFTNFGSNVVLMGGFDDVAVNWYRSTDNGANWTQLTTGSGLLGSGEYPHCGVNLGSGVGVIGTYGGGLGSHLYRTTDSGANWTIVNTPSGIQGFFWLESMGNGVVLAGSGITTSSCRLYISRDNGVTWTVQQQGFGSTATHVLCIESLGYGVALVGTGTDGSVWRLTERGAFGNGVAHTFTGVAQRDTNTTHDTLFGGSGTDADVYHGNPALVVQPTSRDVYFSPTTYSGPAAWAAAWPTEGVNVSWALTYDGANAELFINGVSKGAVAITTPYSPNSGSFKIGGYGPSASLPFDGKMQDVAVYESALTADQIRQLSLAATSPYLFDSAWLSVSGLSGTATTRSGAYDPVGSGNTVIRGSTSPNWVGLCETGALPHYGPFRGKVRLWTDATDAQVRLAYKVGDAPFKRLNPVVLQAGLASQWVEVDLGMVDIAQAPLGTQKTVLRVEFKATTSAKTLDVDYLELIPATRYGKARSPLLSGTPAVFSGLSTFDTESGAITGDSATIGGTWAALAGSDTDDFSVAAGVATRNVASDTGTIAGSTLRGRAVGLDLNLTATAASLDIQNAGDGIARSGLLLRVVDASNFLAVLSNDATPGGIGVYKVIAGTSTLLASLPAPLITQSTAGPTNRLTVVVLGSVVSVWFGLATAIPTLRGAVAETVLGTTLATGDVYMYDDHIGATPTFTRTYDNFSVWVPEADAAIFSGKTGEFRCDDTLRQDSGGTIYGRPSVARGPGVFIPQAGSESKVSRIVAKAARNDIEAAPRDNIADSLKLQVYATPRYLVTPR